MAHQGGGPSRGRGRPRGRSDARARILAAAAEEFAERGYDAATMRSIAGRAGVDAALLHHYFGTKADLFAETIGAPLRPDLEIPRLLAGDRGQLGESIVRFVLSRFEVPEVRTRGVVLLRTAIGNRLATPLLAGFLSRELLGRIATEIGGDDAELRAALAGSQIAGLLITRYVLQLPGIATAPADELVRRVGPVVQAYLVAPR
ncbi:TetR family transcriptional regulator [Microbacterium sp. 179-B 1A2 NHS]|uniref:TetR/AcrR family transcriptional regulator n=1 Tax=Microbacterium sp. 179-B 1A2 NHS TaxID=3142383 RepID=UPI00399F752A